MASESPGLRERKKQRTRELIAATALRLFAERGFDGVTVAEIAREAEVSEKTVFNYFSTKEALVYDEEVRLGEMLLESVRVRRPGQSALAAYAATLFEHLGALRTKAGRDALERMARITRSPSLGDGEDRIFARHRDGLAALLADEAGAEPGDIEPALAAGVLVAFRRALLRTARVSVLTSGPEGLLTRFQTDSMRALSMLERGFASYAIRDAQRGRNEN